LLALAFWLPYSPTPVCPDGIQVSQARVPHDLVAVGVIAWSRRGSQDCRVWVNRNRWRFLTPPWQCAALAHEIGHMWFDLPHGPGIMAAELARPPGICFGP